MSAHHSETEVCRITMRHAQPTVKTFIVVCTLVTGVLFTLVRFSSDIKSVPFSLESASLDVEFEMNSTVSSEKEWNNITTTGETLLSEYECDPTTSTEKGLYFRREEQEEQGRRRTLLDKVCAEENAKITKFERKHFLLDRRHSIFYCWIHKVASTSWIAFMTSLKGRRVRPKKIYREINRLAAESVEELQSAARDYHIRFIVVRHPFRRLISAYRDRIWAATKKYSAQAWTHVPRILRLTRPTLFRSRSSASIMCNGDRTLTIVPTFEEFVQYLLKVANINQSIGMHPEGHLGVTQGIQPNISAFDVHWVPYYHHCSICSIPYNVIIKLETIEKDKKYFMEELDIVNKRNYDFMRQTDQAITLINKTEEKYATQVKLKNISSLDKEINEKNHSVNGEEKKASNLSQSFLDQDKKCLQVIENSVLSDLDLHHLQVSNIGPSCPCYYFSQLSKAQIDGLKKLYEIDLKMFGYEIEEYEKCVKKTNEQY